LLYYGITMRHWYCTCVILIQFLRSAMPKSQLLSLGGLALVGICPECHCCVCVCWQWFSAPIRQKQQQETLKHLDNNLHPLTLTPHDGSVQTSAHCYSTTPQTIPFSALSAFHVDKPSIPATGDLIWLNFL